MGIGTVAMGLIMTVPALAQTEGSKDKNQETTDSSSGQPPKQQPVSTSANSVPAAKGGLPAKLVKDFAGDQVALWTSPKNLRFSDLPWIVPMSGLMAGMLVTDTDFSRHSVSQNPTTQSHYNSLSNYLVFGMVGGAGAMWLLSYHNHNSHWRETGFLAGEAAIDSLVMTEAFKYTLRRDRPYQDNGNGDFFQGGGTSFPSEHSTIAWSIASVVAHEYPGTLTKILAYGAAGLVSYARIGAHKHFPSDVLAGAMIGELSGYTVYSRHHDPELPGEIWPSWGDKIRETMEKSHGTGNLGSPYVPLDSWVYPAMDRLIAQGFIRSAIVDMRPWTRFECARLVNEAGEQLEDVDVSSSQAARIYNSLVQEFSDEKRIEGSGDNTRARMESAYTRVEGISGEPLSQGYHYDFGQTVINDFGRPYEEGFNNVTGFSAWATDSFFTVYVDAEYQHAPDAPPLTASARQVISQTQNVPVPPATPISQIDQVQLLDTYAGMTLDNWQITFGKQSLWWGPGVGGPMMFSNNGQPITMFRINRVSPFKLPSFLGVLGRWRVELFLGELSGHYFLYQYPTGTVGSWASPISPQPMISGERFSFKPTSNVEFGFSLTTLFAGQGVPFNTHTYLKSFLGTGNGYPGTPQDPGDRRSGFDLSYRLPLLRNWATFYADGFSDDQFSPVAYWDRSAWTGGLYISHFPKASKLDLRIEGVYSDVPAGGAIGHGFFYWNGRYVNGYTNEGNLLGSWIGRDGQGAQAWTNYWFTPKNRIQFNFRHQKMSNQFLPGGGSLTDVGAEGNYALRKTLDLSVSVQYERWLIPSIQPGPSQNVTTSVMLRFEPGKSFYRSADLQATRAGGSVGVEDGEGRP